MYRIATHELGGLNIVKDIDYMSYKQFLDLLEILDVHDTLRKIAQDSADNKVKSHTNKKS